MNGILIIVGILLAAMLVKLLMDKDWLGLALFLIAVGVMFFTGRVSK